MYTIFVSGLHFGVSEHMLAGRLSPAGHVHSVHLCREKKDGFPLGYAYVNFWLKAAAKRAIEMFNFELLLGQPMHMMWLQQDGSVESITNNASLFLKNLDKSINSIALFETFSIFGKVLICKVPVDEQGPQGYGHVQFESETVAEVVMRKLNGMLLNDCEIMIQRFMSWEECEAEVSHCTLAFTHRQGRQAQTVERQKTRQGLNLYIKNLEYFVDDECLRSAFEPFGTIISAKVMMKNGRSRGFGFVRFYSSQEANEAIRVMNGRIWGRKQLYVDIAQTKEDRQAFLAEQNKLPPPWDSYSTFPQAHSLVMPHMPHNLQWISVPEAEPAPVEYSVLASEAAPVGDSVPTAEEAPVEDNVLAADSVPDARADLVEDSVLDPKGVLSANSLPATGAVPLVDTKGLNLYIKNLEYFVDDECLRSAFEPFGTIISAKVMMKNGRSRGFGFVRFYSSQEATKAIRVMNGRIWGRKQLYVDVAQTKEERQAFLAQQHKLPPPWDKHSKIPQAQNQVGSHLDLQWTSVPAPEAAHVENGVLAAEAAPEEDSVLAAEVAPVEENVPVAGAVVLAVNIPAAEAAFVKGSVLAAEADPEEENVSVAVPPAESVPAAEAPPGKDGAMAVARVEENVPVAEAVVMADNVPAADAAPVADSVEENVPVAEAVLLLHNFSTAKADPMEDSVPAAEAAPVEENVPVAEAVLLADNVLAAEAILSADNVPVAKTAPVKDSVPSTEAAPVEDKFLTAEDVPTGPSPEKHLTIYMLESSPVDKQVQKAYEYMLPLIEKIHPTQSKKITLMLVEGENNLEIMNMIRDPEHLRTRVAEMDALLKMKEGGHKLENLSMHYKKSKKKRKGRLNN